MMETLLCVLLLHGFQSLKLSATADTGDVNHTLNSNYDYQSANVTELLGGDHPFRSTENSTSPDSETDSTVTISPVNVTFNETTPTNVNVSTPAEVSTPTNVNDSTPANVSTPTGVPEDNTTDWTLTTTSPPTLSPPLPPVGSLSDFPTDVARLCPCNELQSQCEVNCCCDPDCSAELALFTACTVHRVSGDPKLCSQDAAYHSIGVSADGFAVVQTSVQREVNPDLFCIHFSNNEPGLSHAIPEVPTPGNFDGLFRRFAGFLFGSELEGDTSSTPDDSAWPGYRFGDVMGTQEGDGSRGFLRLPGPSVTAHCLDMNPAGFLRDQTTRCSRNLLLEEECTTLPALNMRTYAGIRPLSGKNEDAAVVAVEIASITYQSVEGAQSPLLLRDDLSLDPVLLTPETGSALCANVVLQASYLITHSEAGEVVNVSVALTLGAVTGQMLPVEQEFHIAFVQEDVEATVHYSGNPGYVFGLPLVAGSRTEDGIVESSDPRGELTLFHGTSLGDCLQGPHQRSAVLFGVDVVSGCTLRLEQAANCSQLSEVLLGVLRGQHFPQYVASFGNSQPQNPMDWVQIKREKIAMEPQSCSIPLSLHLEVKWTNYGSLVNPQAQITSVKEVIHTNTSSLASLSGGSSVISVTSSLTFVPVSAAALPGYKTPPTIDAKLPYGFFFPFV